MSAPLTNPIAADGSYDIPTVPGQDYKLTVTGTWGSGSLAVAELDGTATAAFPDSPLTANGGFNLTAGTSAVRVTLSGATNPSLTLRLVAKR
jgi:hypothetical protein